MCFTPAVSFLTFAIEWVMAGWVLSRDHKNKVNQLSAVILIFLGLYQFTEFMMCSAGNEFFWGKMGFLAYTALPALGFHWVFALKKSKRTIWPVYLIPGAFIVYAIWASKFIESAECGRFFVKTLHNWVLIGEIPYFIYYTLFIVWSGIILINWILKEKNHDRRNLYLLGLIGMLLFTFPTFLVLLVFPMFHLMFPSVLCHFAILYALAITKVVQLNKKIR